MRTTGVPTTGTVMPIRTRPTATTATTWIPKTTDTISAKVSSGDMKMATTTHINMGTSSNGSYGVLGNVLSMILNLQPLR